MKFLIKWFAILWRPLLVGALFGLLISNLVILKETKRQSAERDEALRRAAVIQDQIIENINRNTDKNTEEILKLQRLHACLLVAHDINLPVNDGIREQCAVDIMTTSFAPPPQNQNTSGTTGSPEPQGNTGGGDPEPPTPPTPLLFPEGQGVIRDSVPILGAL